jgi:hypothetical protein
MALSTRTTTVTFSSEGLSSNHTFPAANNVSSPAGQYLQVLEVGDNLINPPIGAQAVTIIPPAQNTIGILLKGAPTDVGVFLHLTDPTTLGLLALSPGFHATPFYLENNTSIFPVRLVWT